MNILSNKVQNELDARLDKFDQCWHRGERPEIVDFLSSTESDVLDADERSHLLIELVRLDLEYRWRQTSSDGSDTAACVSTDRPAALRLPQKPLLEDYVGRFPELGSLADLPVALIADEYRVRHLWGRGATIDEFVQRFPRHASVLSTELQAVDSDLAAHTKGSPGIRVRCPDCHQAMELDGDAPLGDIHCSSCGSCFSLLVDETIGQDTPQRKAVGHFQLLEPIRTGSFGTVWKAHDGELDRIVAVKIPRKGQVDSQETEQFLREARAAGQLKHANIVRVHEVGREADAVFIVSDFVDGLTLADWIRDNRFTAREAANLCAKLAAALHHAHEAGVVHRDLKPANIMLAGGEPHVMDFGLARREVGDVTMTLEGKVLGTPAYMSPEQAQGDAHRADRRSDVYSLGVILFELLTGEKPFRGSMRMVLHQVIHHEPPSLRKLNPSIPRDLETICLRCLEKDPQRRYASAEAVCEDLHRFLDDRPVLARPVSRTTKMYKWCRRNPLIATLSVALLMVLFGGMLGVIRQWSIDSREAELNRRQLYVSDIPRIEDAWESGSAEVARNLLRRHIPRRSEEDLRGFEWYALWKRCESFFLARDFQHDPFFGVFSLAVSPDGRLLAGAGAPGSIIIWDTGTGKIRRRLSGHAQTFVKGLTFSPDNRVLVSSGWNEKTVFWDCKTGAKIKEIGAGYNDVKFSSDGKFLAIAEQDGLSVWDVSDLENCRALHEKLHDGGTWSVSFLHDGSVLASAGNDGVVRLWNVSSGEQLEPPLKEHSNRVFAVAFSPGGDELVSSGEDGTIYVWDTDRRELRRKLRGHTDVVRGIAFSPDGDKLLSASYDCTARLWDVSSGECLRTIRGHEFRLRCVRFAADGETFFTASEEGVVRQWQLTLRMPPFELAEDVTWPIDFSPRGNWLATGRQLPAKVLAGKERSMTPDQSVSQSTQITVWDLSDGTEVATFVSDPDRVMDIAFSPDGTTIAVATAQCTTLWDVRTQRVLNTFDANAPVAYSPNGALLVTGRSGDKSVVKLWDVESGKLLHSFSAFDRLTRCLGFSADGRVLAVGGESLTKRNFVLWDVLAEKELATPEVHMASVNSVTFSPDGRLAATGPYDGRIKLWNAQTWKLLATNIEGRHLGRANSIVFSPDGKTLASGSMDGSVKLWNVATGGLLLELTRHDSSIVSVVFSPDGQALISASEDGQVRVWHAATESDLAAAGW